MIAAPIRRCTSLTSVSHLVGRGRQFAFSMKRLRATKTHEQHYLLSAPATLALAIDESGVEWPEDRPLRVLMHAGSRDALVDRGQWHRFVPAMLGQRGELSITACGVDRKSLRNSRVPEALLPQQRISVSLENGRISEVLERTADQYDLAVCFSELREGPDFLADLVALGDRAIPFYFSSFSSTQALFNHVLLRAHRAEAQSVVAINPFRLVSKRPGENLNRVLSVVRADDLPRSGASIDQDYLDTLEIVRFAVLNSHTTGDPSQTWSVGSALDDTWTHSLDGVAINTETFEVKDLHNDRIVGHLSETYRDHIDPVTSDVDETDRMVWASYVRYITMADGLLTSVDNAAA